MRGDMAGAGQGALVRCSRGALLLAAACWAAALPAAGAGLLSRPRFQKLSSSIAALLNASEPLEGVERARAIVNWTVSADDSPVGILMAGATLQNAGVLNRTTGDDGALDQWKGKVPDAAKAAVDEAIQEVIDDDPDNTATMGIPREASSTYRELQDVVAKAKSLTVNTLPGLSGIGDGGSASAKANKKAEAQAEAAAIMAASEAAVADTYDMPPPPEAISDAPFARKKAHVGVLAHQKRIVSGHPTPMVKVLATTHRIKGPSHAELTRRKARAGHSSAVHVHGALDSPMGRLISLDEVDPDAPTAADVKLEEENPPCAPGTTGPDGGPCEPCPKNTYKDVEGSDACSACPDGTRTAQVGTTSLKDCWDGPMDLESPMGMVMAGPKLSDPDIQNKSMSSEAIKLWKGRVGDAAKQAVQEVKDELISDDVLGVKGGHGQTARELDDVVAKARYLTKRMGDVELGGDAAMSAKNKAEAQADAVAFMAAHEAAVADSYVDDDDSGPLKRKGEILYPFGHHDMHRERGENIGYPGGNRPYYARRGQDEHVGDYLHGDVGGPTHAYYESASMKTGGAGRMQSLDALWEGVPPDQDPQVSQDAWVGGVPGLSPEKQQILEHNVEHQFLSASNGPVSLGAVATGSSAGAAGAGFTGVADSSVWHSSWVAASDSSIAAPSPTFADIKASPTTSYSKANKAGDRIAKQEAAAMTPPGSGMRGPPGDTQAAAATGQAGTSGCSTEQVSLCNAGCESKLNLELQTIDSDVTDSQRKSSCMAKCLGPCAKELGFEAAAAAKIEKAMTTEENLITKLTKDFQGKSVSSAAAAVASDAIKRLEKRAGVASSGSTTPLGGAGAAHQSPTTKASAAAGVWHGAPGLTPAPTPGKTGVMPFPGKAVAKTGAQTGVYDCSGRALTVGSIVGRMVPGRGCEDQYLVLTAGMWKVTNYKQPGAAEVVEMRHGASVKGRVAVTLHGISPGVNMGTRVELVPFVGAFTHWKLLTGATKDMFLPANVQAVTGQGHHNKAGVVDSSGFTAAFHSKKTKNAAAFVDKSGEQNAESVYSMEAKRQNDWGQTSVTEKQDANLAMCPGPSCPSDGPSRAHRIMHLGNPFWKYIIVALVVGVILAFQYLKRINEGVVPAGVLQQEYVQLPNFLGGGGSSGKKDGVELESKGARPCPGMKGSDRIVMVENASDRIIMVDVGGGAAPGGSGVTSSSDTASQDVGYQ